MRDIKWQIFLGVILIAFSTVLYMIHYGIFGDIHHIFIFMLGDLAFVPVEVFLVTIIIHRLLSEREKRSIRNKLNMVIGVFFSEVGTNLLTYLSDLDTKDEIVRKYLHKVKNWKEQDFKDLNKKFHGYKSNIKIKPDELKDLRNFLISKRDFLLRLLENPNLLEHESFTDLLWTVFHLTEEVERGKDFKKISKKDYRHIVVDTVRTYDALVYQWIAYMGHLRKNYPYIFSLSIRTNPFNQKSEPIFS
jgi:hypothetical protein